MILDDLKKSYDGITGAAVWEIADGGFMATFGLYGQRYDVNGNKQGIQFQWTEPWPGLPVPEYRILSDAIPLADGGFLMTWVTGNGWSEGYVTYAERYDANSNKLGTKFSIASTGSNRDLSPSATLLTDGSLVIIWQGNAKSLDTTIQGRRYDVNDGVESVFPVILHENEIVESSVVGTSDGGFLVTWETKNSTDLNKKRFDANGNEVEWTVSPVNTRDQFNPSPVDDSGIYLTTEMGAIYRWDIATKSTTLLVETGLPLTDIAFHPDGRVFAITASLLYQIDLSTGNSTLVSLIHSDLAFNLNQLIEANGFDISPDGVGRISGDSLIIIHEIDLETGELTPTSVSTGQPLPLGDIWSEGETLYVATHDGVQNIMLLPPDFNDGLNFGVDFFTNVHGLVGVPAGMDGDLIGFSGNTAYLLGSEQFPAGEFAGYATLDINGVITGATMKRGVNIDSISSDSDRLFNWAESEFDNLFPNHPASQEIEDYHARIYENGNALGEQNNNIYFYDGNSITLVGTVNDFLPDAISAGF